MAVPVQKFREAVFQMLYSYDISRANEDDMLSLLMKELCMTKKAVMQAQDRVREIAAKQSLIDEMIARASQSYTFERIQTVERNILRLGVYELFFDEEIPPKVAIAEALRLTRKFGTTESAAFVNAILDHLYKESLGEKKDTSYLEKSADDLMKSEQIAHDAATKKNLEEKP